MSCYLKSKFELTWTDVEIKNDVNGKPEAITKPDKLKEISMDLSISHCKDYAVAMVIAVKM